jgi:hypothetical protein
MQLSIPTSPVYYFELTPRGPRLLYYLPYDQLAKLVKKKDVRKEVLKDFPYGLEVEVSDEEFRRIREEYGFTPPLDVDEIWKAFRGFWLHSRHGSPSICGLIDAKRLEAYARKVSEAMAPGAPERVVKPSQQLDDSMTPTKAERSGLWRNAEDRMLEAIPPQGANRELEMDQQSWSKVPKSRGLSAEQVFATAQAPEKRGRRG